MKEISSFIAVGLIALIGGLYTLQAGILAPVPGLGMILGVSAVLMWWVALRLRNDWNRLSPSERANAQILNQMRWLFIFGAIFMTFDLFPHVILVVSGFDEQTITTAHWVTHLFLFVYLIIAARMAVSFYNPRYKTHATVFVGLVSLAALTVSAMRPDYLVHIPGSVYPLVSSDPLYAMFNMISNVTSAGIFGVYLILMGLLGRSGTTTRIRSILLGIGFQGLVALGFLIHYSHSANTAAMIFVASIVWSLGTGLGALYGRSRS